MLGFEELFRGTIDGCSVYPREVAKAALLNNAAAVLFYHCHPSGDPTPSRADELLTPRLRDALALFDIRVVDHVIVGGTEILSFAERSSFEHLPHRTCSHDPCRREPPRARAVLSN